MTPRRLRALALLAASGAPGGIAFVGVLGRAFGSPYAEQVLWPALTGLCGGLTAAALIAAWFLFVDEDPVIRVTKEIDRRETAFRGAR